MGVSIEVWGAKVGTFTQLNKAKMTMRTLKTKHTLLLIRMVLFFLLVANGVESNPGPTVGKGKGQSSRVGRRTQVEVVQHVETDIQQHSQQRSTRGRTSALEVNQGSLNTWLNATGTSQETEQDLIGDTNSETQYDSDITELENNGNTGTMNTQSLLLEIHRDVKKMNNKFDSMDGTIG